MCIQCHETVTVYTVLLYNARCHHAVIVHTVSLYAMYIVTIQCNYSVIKRACDSVQCHYIRVQYTVYIYNHYAVGQCSYIVSIYLHVHWQCQYHYTLYIVNIHLYTYRYACCTVAILYSVATNLSTVYN